MKLSSQAALFSGASAAFFNKEVTGDGIEVNVLRGADLSDDGVIRVDHIQKSEVKSDKKIEKYYLKAGDVVLLSRGMVTKCSLVTQEVEALGVVATANFIVIRLAKGMKGEFLVAYFNSEFGKQALNSPSVTSSGSVINSISLSGLKDMNIEFPNALKQQEIAEVLISHLEAKKATLALLEKQQKLAEAKILNLMMGE